MEFFVSTHLRFESSYNYIFLIAPPQSQLEISSVTDAAVVV